MKRGLPFELFLGFRYLGARGQRTNLSLFVWIGVGGVFLGVAALIVVLAVMTGFQDGIRDRIISANPHLLVFQSGTAGLSDADAVAAHDAQREVLQQSSPTVAVCDVANLDDLASRRFRGLIYLHPGRARPLLARGTERTEVSTFQLGAPGSGSSVLQLSTTATCGCLDAGGSASISLARLDSRDRDFARGEPADSIGKSRSRQ